MTVELVPKRKQKYVPGLGKTPPELQRSRCPSCGAWRVSTFVCEPCERCVETIRPSNGRGL